MSPVLSGSKRSFAESGVNFTLPASLNMAAAMARQKSTSKPVQLPLSSGLEKPGRPWLTPQTTEPRSFTDLSVWADTALAEQPNANTPSKKIACFMREPSGQTCLCTAVLPVWCERHLRTIRYRGQGVDALQVGH